MGPPELGLAGAPPLRSAPVIAARDFFFFESHTWSPSHLEAIRRLDGECDTEDDFQDARRWMEVVGRALVSEAFRRKVRRERWKWAAIVSVSAPLALMGAAANPSM